MVTRRVSDAAQALARGLRGQILSSDNDGIFVRVMVPGSRKDQDIKVFEARGGVLGWGVPQHSNHLSDFERGQLQYEIDRILAPFK